MNRTVIVAIITIFIIILIFIIYFLFIKKSNVPDIEKMKQSKNYDQRKGSFINRRPELIDNMKKKSMNLREVIKWFTTKGNDEIPRKKLPEIKPNLSDFLKSQKKLKIIWFGHSTLLLNMDGNIILVDPIFSSNASPIPFMIKRFQSPVLQLNELPDINYIVISHDHYDHLDKETVKFFKDKKTKFIIPLGVGHHLKNWGIKPYKIIEKDWWQEQNFDGIKFIATPSQHFSGRSLIDGDDTLWASWVIQTDNHNIYYSGDSGYDIHFKKIGKKYGPFDVVFIDTGQYNEKWRAVHMNPKEATQAYYDLRSKKFFPIHWGMFKLSFHSWFEPVVKLTEISQDHKINLIVPRLGEIINLNEEYKLIPWWIEGK